MKNNFFGNDSIVIIFMGIGLIAGVLTNQDSITTAAIGALAGYLGGEAKHSIEAKSAKDTEPDTVKDFVKSAMEEIRVNVATSSSTVTASEPVGEESAEATTSN